MCFVVDSRSLSYIWSPIVLPRSPHDVFNVIKLSQVAWNMVLFFPLIFLVKVTMMMLRARGATTGWGSPMHLRFFSESGHDQITPNLNSIFGQERNRVREKESGMRMNKHFPSLLRILVGVMRHWILNPSETFIVPLIVVIHGWWTRH